MRGFANWIFTGSLTYLCTSQALALPIGFGRPPGGQDYGEIKSKNFYVYHDKRAPHEAASMLRTLEAIRPHMQQWFAERRQKPLPIVMSATTSQASFSNFITDAIEIQTMGQGPRDLAWHEYVHSMMYEDFHNWLGPAGSILHLMWLPSWFVEGLAEALSVSIGSDEQASIERVNALTGDWPTYARLHSLYADPSFSYQGYAVSGAFVAWLLRSGLAEKLPTFLNDYFFNSMPWYWPYSILPLANSMPLDNALKKHFGKTGEELYEAYKIAATKHWKERTQTPLLMESKSAEEIDHKTDKLQNGMSGELSTDRLTIFAEDRETLRGEHNLQIFAQTPTSQRRDLIVDRPGHATHLIISKKYVAWREVKQEITRLCFADIKHFLDGSKIQDDAITCPFEETQPRSVTILGMQKIVKSPTEQIWLRLSEQTIRGDRHGIIFWNLDGQKHYQVPAEHGDLPLAVAYVKDTPYLLSAERSRRVIKKISANGKCEKVYPLSDFPTNIESSEKDDKLIVTLYASSKRKRLRIAPDELKSITCYPSAPHTSPMLFAMRSPKRGQRLSTAVLAASTWRQPAAREDNFIGSRIKKAAPLDKTPVAEKQIENKPKEDEWRARPIFAVPWLGADGDGAQIGLLSIPLMDHLQNEEVRLYLGYGAYSNFPHTEVTLRSTRFWPTWKLDAFRYQTWNGRYYKETDPDTDGDGPDERDGYYANAYLDEQGVRLTTDLYLHSIHTNLNLGIKQSRLKRWRGRQNTREGILREPFAGITKSTTLGKFVWSKSFTGRVAPESMNTEFDYNQLAAATKVSRGLTFLSSTWSLGLEGSRTRGKKLRELQESYRPLKIFVPGSGGGYNNLSFPLVGSGGLFDARYGNNQMRSSTTYSFPIIKRIDRLVRLIYMEQLTFTAFFNYGGAWFGNISPESDDLIAAHGYNFDLHFDVKGFNFHIGQGIGQVFGSGLESYATFSFDAVF